MTLFKRRQQLYRAEITSPLPAEVIHAYPQEDVSEFQRVAKRRRIETYAQDYLKGREIFISTASLKGPFDSRWSNPWGAEAYARQDTARLDKVLPSAEHGVGYEALACHERVLQLDPRSKIGTDYCQDWVLEQEEQEYSNHVNDGIEGRIREIAPDTPTIPRPAISQKSRDNGKQNTKSLQTKTFGRSPPTDSSSNASFPVNSMRVDVPTTDCAATDTPRDDQKHLAISIHNSHDNLDLTKVSAITEGDQFPKATAKKRWTSPKRDLSTKTKPVDSPGFPFRRVAASKKPSRMQPEVESEKDEVLIAFQPERETSRSILDELEETGVVLVSQDNMGRWLCPMEPCSGVSKSFSLRPALSNHLKNAHNIHKTRTDTGLKSNPLSSASSDDEEEKDKSSVSTDADSESPEATEANRESAIEVAANAQGQWPCPITGCSTKPCLSRWGLTRHLKAKHAIKLPPKAATSAEITKQKLSKSNGLGAQAKSYPPEILLAKDADDKWPCSIAECPKHDQPYSNRQNLELHLQKQHNLSQSDIVSLRKRQKESQQEILKDIDNVNAASPSQADETDIKSKPRSSKFEGPDGSMILLVKDEDGNWPCPVANCFRHGDPYPYRKSVVFHMADVHRLTKVQEKALTLAEKRAQKLEQEEFVEVHADSNGLWLCPIESCQAKPAGWASRKLLQKHISRNHGIHRTFVPSAKLDREQKREPKREQSASTRETSFDDMGLALFPNTEGKFSCPISECAAQTKLYERNGIDKHLQRTHGIARTHVPRPWIQGPATVYIYPNDSGTFPCPLVDGCATTKLFTKSGAASHLKRVHKVDHVYVGSKEKTASDKYGPSFALVPTQIASRSTSIFADSRSTSEHLEHIAALKPFHDAARSTPATSDNHSTLEKLEQTTTLRPVQNVPRSTVANSSYSHKPHAEAEVPAQVSVKDGSNKDSPNPETLSATVDVVPGELEAFAEHNRAQETANEPVNGGTNLTLPDRQPDSRAYSTFTVNPDISTQMALEQAHEAFRESPSPEKPLFPASKAQEELLQEEHVQSALPTAQDTTTPFKLPARRRLSEDVPASDFGAIPANTQDLLDAAAELSFSTIKKKPTSEQQQTSPKDLSPSESSHFAVAMKGVEWSPVASTPSSESVSKFNDNRHQLVGDAQTPVTVAKPRKVTHVAKVENTPISNAETKVTPQHDEETFSFSPVEKVNLALLAARALTPSQGYFPHFRPSQTPSGPSEMPVPSYQQAQQFNTQDIENTLDDAVNFLGTWDIGLGDTTNGKKKALISSSAA